MQMQERQLLKGALGSLVLAIALLTVMVLSGCKNPFVGVVTLTRVMESARAQYDTVFRQGLVPASVETKAQEAWLRYQQSATVAANALEVYKATGDSADYTKAFALVRSVVLSFVDIITPVIAGTDANTLKLNANRAEKL